MSSTQNSGSNPFFRILIPVAQPERRIFFKILSTLCRLRCPRPYSTLSYHTSDQGPWQGFRPGVHQRQQQPAEEGRRTSSGNSMAESPPSKRHCGSSEHEQSGSKEIPGLRQAEIPKLVHVRQAFPSEHLVDVPASATEALAWLWPEPASLKGKSIGITVGSRGITTIDVITKAAVDFLLRGGAKPFIFPAMGSHGGGTAEGQVLIPIDPN
eukprot:SAG31_NODE_1014_length_10366_cov_2.357129_9_plen_211_part_00